VRLASLSGMDGRGRPLYGWRDPERSMEGTMATRSPIPAGDQPTRTYDRDDEPLLPLVDDGDPWEFFFDAEEAKTAVAASSSQPMIV